MIGRKALICVLAGAIALALAAVGVAAVLVTQAISKANGNAADSFVPIEEAQPGKGEAHVSTSGLDGAPVLEFSIPEGWALANRISDSVESPHPLGHGAETLDVENSDTGILLHYWPCPSSLYANAERLPKATVTKVADAAFDPAPGASSGQSDAGPFMVARAEYSSDPIGNHMTTRLVLLPESFAGEHQVAMVQTTCFLGFQYAGYAILFSSGDVGELSEEEQLQAIEVLASLHVA